MLIGLGGNLSFGAPAQIRPFHRTSEKHFQAVQPVVAIFKDNSYQELPEPSEDVPFGSLFLAFENNISIAEEAARKAADFGFKRDLRTELSRQVFPTHFFL